MTLQEQLCEKMRVEQSAYCLWLTAQPPEEILHHAYEYSVREDIILATEEMNLAPAQVRALLKSPAPLADVYKDFSKLETDYMSIVAQCVEDRADDLLKKEQQQNPPKVYRQSVTYAREHGELQQYHASCHLNERCRDEIDAALAQRFDGMRLGAGAVEQVVAEYGLERTKYVLAAAIQTRDGDGRISRTNREWADSIRTIKDMDRRGLDRSCYYADLQAHALVVLFFAISLCKNTMNFHELKRPEAAIHYLIRFVAAKALVSYGMDIMLNVFSICNGIVTDMADSMGGISEAMVSLPAEMQTAIENVGFLASIPLWLVTILGSLFITVLSFVMILTVYGRFFRLYMYTALAPLPLAAFAGESTQSVGISFLKSYVGVCLEGAVIVLACVIYSAFVGTPTVTGGEATTIVWSYLAETVFNMLVLVGLIKGSDRIIHEMMGL